MGRRPPRPVDPAPIDPVPTPEPPVNPVDPVPPPVDPAPVVPRPVGPELAGDVQDGPPTGVPTGTVPRGRIAGGGPWSAIVRWRPRTWAAGQRHGVPWSMLEAMMVVESGGKVDAANPSGATGLMQVKPRIWQRLATPLGYDLLTPEGQIGMAAAILGGDVPDTRGMDPETAFLRVYYPTPGLDVPGEDGDTPRMYLEDIARYRAILEAAAGTTPVTPTAPPAKPVDPLSAILGGRPAPAISYGFKAPTNLPFYAYFEGRGGNPNQHTGWDVPGRIGDSLHAPAAGVVTCAGTGRGPGSWNTGCSAFADEMGKGAGRVEVLLDGGVSLVLGHCSEALVAPGQRVAAGQAVARMGGSNGGQHVHVECRVWKEDGRCD